MRVAVKQILIGIVVLLMIGCQSAPSSSGGGSSSGGSSAPKVETTYQGSGQDASLLTAMNQAKMDAVKKAVTALIGSAEEQANQAKLQEVLYGTSNPNAYVDKSSMETLVKDKIGGEYVYEISIDVDIPAVESVLKANGIGTSGGGGGDSYASAAQDAAGGTASSVSSGQPTAEEAWGKATQEERNKMSRYIDTLSYMVYFDEESVQDPRYVRSAVTMANEFLASQSKTVYDMEQVEELKKDQQMAYEEETGTEVSILQWMAQKLNADVYVEVAAEVEGQSQGGNYYGTANVTLKFFETSTGQLLASQPFNSPRAFSKTSEFAAINNALQSSVYKAMPPAMEQAEDILGKSFLQGLQYEITIQNTPDNRMMSSFRRKLNRRVKYLQVQSQSPEETKMTVYYVGQAWELEDIIYGVAESVPGMEGLYQVMMRGRSITFNTGM